MRNDGSLLQIDDITTEFSGDFGTVRATDGVTLAIRRKEIFGLVGESGSGKTMTALSVIRLVPPPGKVTRGAIIFEGKDILAMGKAEVESIRGNRIGMIFQEPMTALNPVLRVGDQIGEVLAIHRGLGRKEVREQVLGLLRKVGFPDAERRFYQYPHQLSGGQRQRVLIAMAICCEPSLVIADEPTTALDVATESQILELLGRLVEEEGSSLLFISHNLNVISRICGRVGIMYAGRVLEVSRGSDFFRGPLHPYGQGLLESVSGLLGREKRLKAVPGSVPRLTELPGGCKFHPRCPHVMDRCREEEPALTEREEERWVRCFLYQN